MPFVKRQRRKYYKYQDWSQPINPTGITATSGWTNPANAFDGLADTYAACGTDTDYIEWDLGANILLSGVTATGQWADSVARACNLIIKSVNDLGVETTLGKTTGSASTSTYTLKTTFSETIVNKLRFYLTTSDGGSNPTTTYKTRIREINLTANRQVIESTSSDYDYYIDSNKLYNLIKRHRTYYKYDGTKSFVQPILSSNGIMGGNSFAVSSNVTQYDSSDCAVYKAFDNTANTQFHSTSGVKTGYIDIYNLNPLNITNIKITNQGVTNRASSAGIIYGSSDSEKWEQIATYTNTVQNGNGVWDIDLSSNTKYYKYYRLESTAGGSDSYWTIGELTLTAQEKVGVEINVGGGDIWKNWKQPVLSANGTLGGDKFAVGASSYYDSPRQPFNAFDGENSSSESGCWHAGSGYPQWLAFYNPKPLRVTNLKISNRLAYQGGTSALLEYQIQTSINGNNWVTIYSGTNENTDSQASWDIDLSNANAISKYMRIYITSGHDSNYVAIGEIEITAQELKAVGGTIEDADYYTSKIINYEPYAPRYEVISQMFSVSDELQTYVVPDGVDKLNVVCVGSRGGNSGGLGGRVICDLNVTAGQTLYVTVGGIPTSTYIASYNASDIRIDGTGYDNRIIVAGGGGSMSSRGAAGGAGGGLIGADGNGHGNAYKGYGGTQTAGGAGGSYAAIGQGHSHAGGTGGFGLGGDGTSCGYCGQNGAGGAGWYGGGAGAAQWNKNGAFAAGGGGGSSYTDDTLCSNVVHAQGINSGEGYVKISYIKELKK